MSSCWAELAGRESGPGEDESPESDEDDEATGPFLGAPAMTASERRLGLLWERFPKRLASVVEPDSQAQSASASGSVGVVG